MRDSWNQTTRLATGHLFFSSVGACPAGSVFNSGLRPNALFIERVLNFTHFCYQVGKIN